MSYVVLARKWRPMSFRDLIGQEHVSRTLANAIERGRVAHAFLFTGVRGVGKTTSARILAKALNCLEPSAERHYEPCLACAACREIADGTDMDVREIDAASYTGVDEIRKLQESLPYRPTRDRYKIFIVDEVHMLSQNAWNALLKTLEEPPPHVKFIFATTEVHKVPVTILSRVQRFDFRLIPSRLIADRLRFVLQQENIAADERAVALVAREAAGSMRDALSLLDQVIAFNPTALAGDEVARVLGLAGHHALVELAAAVLAGDAARVLAAIAGHADQSCDATVLARDLLGTLRDLVVAKLCANPDELLDLSDEEREHVRSVAARWEAQELVRVQQGFAKGFDDVARAPDPRGALEMLLVRLSLRPELLPLDALVARLADLEARLSASKPPAGAPPTRPGPAPGGGAQRARPRPAPTQSSPSSAAPLPAPGHNHHEPARDVVEAPPTPRPSRGAPPGVAGLDGLAPPVAPPAPTPARPPAPPVPEATPNAVQSSSDSSGVEDWRRVLDHLAQTRPDFVAFLKHTVPVSINPELFTLGHEPGHVLEAAVRSEECVRALRKAAAECLGQEPQVIFQPVKPGSETLADADRRAREQLKRAAVNRAEQHPSVKAAAEILGARVKRIDVGES